MRLDVETLNGVARGTFPPTVRFFRFSVPTVTYGRLQKLEKIQSLIPASWPHAQRPTGGGIVFHQTDLCVSLAWPKNHPPIPTKPKEMYQWIHSVLCEGLGDHFRMAACGDTCGEKKPFAVRECFTEPVGYDLLSGSQKVVGGALLNTRDAVLYQGSIQISNASDTEPALRQAFERIFNPHA